MSNVEAGSASWASIQSEYAVAELPSAINRVASASVAPKVDWLRKRKASAFATAGTTGGGGGGAGGGGLVTGGGGVVGEGLASEPAPPQAESNNAMAVSDIPALAIVFCMPPLFKPITCDR
ncbi:MAG: hypothetical protein ABI645_05860 [Pseudomonadota bacterium]